MKVVMAGPQLERRRWLGSVGRGAGRRGAPGREVFVAPAGADVVAALGITPTQDIDCEKANIDSFPASCTRRRISRTTSSGSRAENRRWKRRGFIAAVSNSLSSKLSRPTAWAGCTLLSLRSMRQHHRGHGRRASISPETVVNPSRGKDRAPPLRAERRRVRARRNRASAARSPSVGRPCSRRAAARATSCGPRRPSRDSVRGFRSWRAAFLRRGFGVAGFRVRLSTRFRRLRRRKIQRLEQRWPNFP